MSSWLSASRMRVDPEHGMIPSLGQLCEVRADVPRSDLAVSGDDGFPLADWDFDSMEDLGSALAAEFALLGSSEIADPLGRLSRSSWNLRRRSPA
jgi:hypothetical protein